MVKKTSQNKRGAPVKWTSEAIKQIGDDLLKWSQKEDSLFIQGFLGGHRLPIRGQLLSEWALKNEEFKDTYTRVRTRLLGRIYTKACFKELDGSYVARIMPLIDPEYRAWRQEELKITGANENKRIEVIVNHGERKEEV